MKRKKTSFQFINIIKKLPILLAVVVVCYTVVLLKTIEFPTLLPVTDIQVKGQLNYLDKKEIRSMVQGAINGGFFTMDLKNVRELLMEKPWVDNVSLRKMWPARLDVIVEEKTPIAYWNGDAYLSEKGNVFKPTSIDNNLNLPGLKGPEGQHDNVWKFMNVLYKETARLNYEVVRLALDERRAWRLTIAEKDNEKNQIDIKLGRYETDKRLQRFVRILPTLITQDGFVENKVRAIDMRFPMVLLFVYLKMSLT
ncbi:MAG: cell division protein FtsQ/DivIB [Gammaproteobacteria bacterium]|nr:cell division protein FtsQ/DivIB [Gammaproteobacteria bacterium]